MPTIRQVALIVNCGYARVCIYNNSVTTAGRHARHTIDKKARSNNFKFQFSTCSSYGIPDGYFDSQDKHNQTQFDRDCSKILDGFKSKFRSDIGLGRDRYLQTFSFSKWAELFSIEKSQHTLGRCNRCYEIHKELQGSYPLKPFYQAQPVVEVNTDFLKQQGVKKFTTNVLAELNRVYVNEGGPSFTDALVTTKSSGLERKKTSYEKRKEKRKIEKEVVKAVNESFSKKAAITLLTENQLKRQYHRMRLAQSQCSPEEQPPPKRRKTHSHSPNFENVEWDTKKLLTTLQNWPANEPINWSKVGKDHGI